jgi:predicted N-formylglutamate amidohydrolase
VTVANEGGRSPFLLIADHAGTAIPKALGDLGVGEADLKRHIACDIGIRGVGERLSALLDATFIHQHYSRLVIDCNRNPAADGAIPKESDGTPIPGNEGLSAEQRAARVAEICCAYQNRIGAEIEARKGRGQKTVLISLHSFTPVMKGFKRPWRFGVLHREDSPFSRAVLEELRATLGDEAGDNEPYRMDEIDYTVPLHADGHGIDYLEIEVRQDQIEAEEGQAAIAARLADILPRALADIG